VTRTWDELRSDVLNPEVKTSEVLFRAKALAKVLGLEVPDWIHSEIDGWTAEPPEYRRVHGRLVSWNPFRQWIPVSSDDPRDLAILAARSSQFVGQPGAELEELTGS
jgi:hypothetical protein